MSAEEFRSKGELTADAKDAIRTYILKLVIPPAAALTIISGLLGFVVSGLARIDASATSAADARTAALDAVKAAADAKNSNFRATEAAKNADDAYVVLQKAKTQMDQILVGQYSSFAQALFATKDFRTALGKLGDQQVKDIYSSIDKWSGATMMDRGNASEVTMDNQFADPTLGRYAECKTPGTYMTKLETVMDRAHGAVWGFRVVCRGADIH